MLDDILLEDEQKKLLEIVVEAARNVSPDARRKFMVFEVMNAPTVLTHPGLPGRETNVYSGDVEELGAKGLFSVRRTPKGALMFDVTPEGFHYHDELRAVGTPCVGGDVQRPFPLELISRSIEFSRANWKWLIPTLIAFAGLMIAIF